MYHSERLHRVNDPELRRLQESSGLSQCEYDKQKNRSEHNQISHRRRVLHVQRISQAPVDIDLLRKTQLKGEKRRLTFPKSITSNLSPSLASAARPSSTILLHAFGVRILRPIANFMEPTLSYIPFMISNSAGPKFTGTSLK